MLKRHADAAYIYAAAGATTLISLYAMPVSLYAFSPPNALRNIVVIYDAYAILLRHA